MRIMNDWREAVKITSQIISDSGIRKFLFDAEEELDRFCLKGAGVLARFFALSTIIMYLKYKKQSTNTCNPVDAFFNALYQDISLTPDSCSFILTETKRMIGSNTLPLWADGLFSNTPVKLTNISHAIYTANSEEDTLPYYEKLLYFCSYLKDLSLTVQDGKVLLCLKGEQLTCDDTIIISNHCANGYSGRMYLFRRRVYYDDGTVFKEYVALDNFSRKTPTIIEVEDNVAK